MQFKLVLSNIQHINKLVFDIDLSQNKLMCIVGKNGVGKTTLIRAIKNLKAADTFTKTASPYIFNNDSSIEYTIDGTSYNYKYNSNLQVVDTKEIIDKDIIDNIYVELPIPHGDRFNHFQRLTEIDEELRKSIPLKNYTTPDELIDFLTKVYGSDRFDQLKEVKIKNSAYYFILREDDFYIREDYLSSGEFFVINLYKMIQRRCKLIVIDEIDISLDASAQVNLVTELRRFCEDVEVNIIFTTHSLALMKTLKDLELHYMEMKDAVVTLESASYNYVKSVLFGFKGWDRYILTEDKMLKNYLMFLLSKNTDPVYSEYTIIYIGGGPQVIGLMRRNELEEFFAPAESVISILDGDQRDNEGEKVWCIPFESVEKKLFACYKTNELRDEIRFDVEPKNAKDLYHKITTRRRQGAMMTEEEIFLFINEKQSGDVQAFTTKLIAFLNAD